MRKKTSTLPEPKPNGNGALNGHRSDEYSEYDGILMYMRGAAEVPLLTVTDEIKLAARIKRGDMKARDQMIRANLRLVVKIARAYENYGLPLLDLISEGNIGLMKAVERFDPKKGAKLSTYAGFWIKQSIKKGLADQSRTIRIPVHQVDKLSKMRKTEKALRNILYRDPTDEELAEEMKISVEKLRELRESTIQPTSMEAHLGDEDSSRLENIVKDESVVGAYDELEKKNNLERILGHLDSLCERERTILTRRYGLNGDDPQTLEEVGNHFKVTRERIRQIQDEALRKLKKRMDKEERV